MSKRLLFCILCPLLLSLCACQNYDFKVNEKIVYTPHPLFRDFNTADQALRTCLEQAIADGGVSAASQLTALNCSHAGIESLDGIASFGGIKTLRLSSNTIRNLVDLGSIATLEELYLDNNQIIDPVPLYQLPGLRFIDLSGNPDLQCPRNARLDHIDTVILPVHCR